MVIPAFLIFIKQRRKEIPFSITLIFFAIFITGCGFTHFMGALEFFTPWFWVGVIVNCVTAVASIATLIYMIPLLPKILLLKTPLELEKMNNELIKTKEQLYQMNQSLLMRLQASEAFNQTVSHDLNAPLRTIDGFTEILIQDFVEGLDRKGKLYIYKLRNAALKMKQLIKDMQRLSIISQPNMQLQLRTISLTNMFKVILSETRMADDVTRDVDVRIQEDMTACADPEILALAINNLVSNAWKYTSKNPKAVIEIGCNKVNDQTVYYIKDNGVGFDPSKISELFQPFKRLHGAEFEGSGIGLTITKRVIELHQGKIWATGQVNRGATFFFTLGS
jgi:signal transduction histidine kinase